MPTQKRATTAHHAAMALRTLNLSQRKDLSQMPKQNTKKRATRKAAATATEVSAYIDREARCEALAAAAVQGFDEKQELALVSLLYEIWKAPDAKDLAFNALISAFHASRGLHEKAIHALIELHDQGGEI